MAEPSTGAQQGRNQPPTQERIDDDVENPQREGDISDDEDLYTPSAPLLSARTRGNEPPQTQKLCWYHRLASLLPSRKQNTNSTAWQTPSKPRDKRRIFLFSFIGLIMAAVIGLATSTGILARQLDSCRASNGGWYQRVRQHTTRLPLSNRWLSSNGRLDFTNVYPPLESSRSPACQAAWNSLRWLPCHEKIWNRSWDDGKRLSLFDPDIGLYSEAICTPSCTNHLFSIAQMISVQCTEDDRFDLQGYRGPFLADPGLEDGPLGVMQTINKRVTHLCRVNPERTTYPGYHWSPPGYCSAILWEDWQIIDGINAGNLEGLDAFDRLTSTQRWERETYKSHMMSDDCDDASYWRSRISAARKFGPGRNDTTCGWCLMNWFERKLMAWEEDKVFDPKTGRAVGLKEYLERIKKMGRRCESDAWDKAWERAKRKYKVKMDFSEGEDAAEDDEDTYVVITSDENFDDLLEEDFETEIVHVSQTDTDTIELS